MAQVKDIKGTLKLSPINHLEKQSDAVEHLFTLSFGMII